MFFVPESNRTHIVLYIMVRGDRKTFKIVFFLKTLPYRLVRAECRYFPLVSQRVGGLFHCPYTPLA